MVHIRTSICDKFPRRGKRKTWKELWVQSESKWCEEANPFGFEIEDEKPNSKQMSPTPQSRVSRREKPKSAGPDSKELSTLLTNMVTDSGFQVRALRSASQEANPLGHDSEREKPGTKQTAPTSHREGSQFRKYDTASSKKAGPDAKELSALLTRMVAESRHQFRVLRSARRHDSNFDQQIRDLERCKTACQQTLLAMDDIAVKSIKAPASVIPPRYDKHPKARSSLLCSRSVSPVAGPPGTRGHTLPSPKYLSGGLPLTANAPRPSAAMTWSPPRIDFRPLTTKPKPPRIDFGPPTTKVSV